MKINKRSIRKSAIAAVATVLLGIASSCTDLWSEQHPGTYYISDGKTIATFLEDYRDPETGEQIFSDFIWILKYVNKKGDSYWGELKTYGDRTLFAPTNKALKNYLEERKNQEPDPVKKELYFSSVQSLPDSIIDSIRRTHLCKETMFLDDLRDAKNRTLPFSNMLNRYLRFEVFDKYPDPNDSSNVKVAYKILPTSTIIEPDDSTVNGVIHIIDEVIRQSTETLPGYLRLNNIKAKDAFKATIFLKALEETRLSVQLEKTKDPDYPAPAYDSTLAYIEMTGESKYYYETGNENVGNGQQQRQIWPDERLFKFTLFAVTDSVLKKVYNITDALEDGIDGGISLKTYAKSVYTDHTDDNDTLSTSPLYRLMAYHILPCWLERHLLNFTDPNIIENYKKACPDSIDMEDFYETMQRSIIRVSTPYDKGSGYDGKYVFINRKGTESAGLEVPGIRIWNSDELPDGFDTEGALNGGYYFIDRLLLFDENTKQALNTRIRISGNTLSPDFINSGARGRMRQTLGDKPTTFTVYNYKDGYCTNVRATEQTTYVVRYQDKNWDIMNNDEMNIKGNFDIVFRLPPVPRSDTYEIRLFINCQSTTNKSLRNTRGIVHFLTYAAEPGLDMNSWMSWGWEPCGIPVDMTMSPTMDPEIGSVMDKNAKGSTPEEKELFIQANDKAMHNRGFMKAPAGYSVGSDGRLRHHDICFRKIVTTMPMDPDKDYYLRMRQIKEDGGIAPMNIVEIVPKSIYAGGVPEDRY